MGPPTGRAPVADELRPQTSPTRQTRRRVPSPQPDEHITTHASVNNQYPSSQDSATISRSQERIPVSQPDQQQQQQWQQQQHQTFVNNQYPNTNVPPQTHNSAFNSDQQFQYRNSQIRDPSPQGHTQFQDPTLNSSDFEEPQEDEVDSHPYGGHVRTNVRVNVSTEKEVCESTPDILTSFIVDRMEYDGYNVPPGLSSRGQKNESAIAVVLRRMGDDISKNYQLNHYISEIQVTPNTAYKTFASVACQIFTDGNINWGRVVMLFYFAYKLALQVLNQLPLIDIIIGWVTQFVAERLASWISGRGGWSAIREYYGSTTGQLIGVFLAGVLVSTLFWYWKK